MVTFEPLGVQKSYMPHWTMPEGQPAFHAQIYVLLVSDDLYFLICFGTDVKSSFLIGRFPKI